MTSKLINIEVSEGIPQQKHFHFSVLENFYFSISILFFFTFHFMYPQSIIWWWNSTILIWFTYAWSENSDELNHSQIDWILCNHFSLKEVLSTFFEKQNMNEIDQSYHINKENRYHSCHLSFLNRISLILFFHHFFLKNIPRFCRCWGFSFYSSFILFWIKIIKI